MCFHMSNEKIKFRQMIRSNQYKSRKAGLAYIKLTRCHTFGDVLKNTIHVQLKKYIFPKDPISIWHEIGCHNNNEEQFKRSRKELVKLSSHLSPEISNARLM